MDARASVLLLTVVVSAAMPAAVLSAQQPGRQMFRGQVISPPKTAPLFPVEPLNGQASQALPAPLPTPLFTEVAKMLPPDLKPRVVCGMTLLPAPPDVDPQIAVPSQTEKPKNPTTYTIRPVEPSICW